MSDGRRLPKRTKTILSWPHKRFFSSLVFAVAQQSLAAWVTAADATRCVRVRGADDVCERAGLKMEAALDSFGVDPMGRVAMDSGLSTGGFTDCLLQRGAERVYGVDVGYGQVMMMR